MKLYKNIQTGDFIISNKEIEREGFTFVRDFREMRIRSDIVCNMYFVSEDNSQNDILVMC